MIGHPYRSPPTFPPPGDASPYFCDECGSFDCTMDDEWIRQMGPPGTYLGICMGLVAVKETLGSLRFEHARACECFNRRIA